MSLLSLNVLVLKEQIHKKQKQCKIRSKDIRQANWYKFRIFKRSPLRLNEIKV
jgi:hypothetical protein